MKVFEYAERSTKYFNNTVFYALCYANGVFNMNFYQEGVSE